MNLQGIHPPVLKLLSETADIIFTWISSAHAYHMLTPQLTRAEKSTSLAEERNLELGNSNTKHKDWWSEKGISSLKIIDGAILDNKEVQSDMI